MRKLLRFLVRGLFRFRAFNESVLTTPGPVLLIPNHVSWLDWLFLGVCLDDDWKFVTSSTTAETSWVHRLMMINRLTFPVDTTSPYAVKRMAEFLERGGRLVLFAEGRLSATGTLMKLFDGTGFLLFKTRSRVITAYLRGTNRLRWVRHAGWTRWFPPVTAHFSEVLQPPVFTAPSTARLRQMATLWLRDQMVRQQFRVETEHGARHVLAAFEEMAALRPRQEIIEDATRQVLTYRRLSLGAELLARRWRGRFAGQPRVGVLLPNVNSLPAVLLSLWRAGGTPAILNFSTGPATMLACAQLAGLKTIITSSAFLTRAKLNVDLLRQAGIEFVYLEEIRTGIGAAERLILAAARFFKRPPAVDTLRAEDAAVVLFTSGSEGVPKGVELTHANLLGNVRQMLGVIDLEDRDRVFNALPMFHSFGLTVGTLLPLLRGLFVFVYPSPLHYRIVPLAVYERNCTVLLGTNTFLNGYARKAHGYDFHSVRFLIAAAEKLQEATANAWARNFGVRVLEGYGATECSPALTVNTPMCARYGSAGRFLPEVEWQLEPVEGVAEGGRLLVRGPNIMRGYLNPDANAAFRARGGWYDTGDIVRVDEDNYVFILGRLKRFAKVSGEMVSLTAVEDALAGAFPRYGLRCQIAVLTRPDEDKGEALIAVCNEPRLQLDEIRAAIKAKGLSNLCVPREIVVVREISKLGTGKVNHRELARQLAEAKPSA